MGVVKISLVKCFITNPKNREGSPFIFFVSLVSFKFANNGHVIWDTLCIGIYVNPVQNGGMAASPWTRYLTSNIDRLPI